MGFLRRPLRRSGAILLALLLPSVWAAAVAPATSLLARGPHAARSRSFALTAHSTDASPTCVPLTNAGTHFTVDVEVGMPGQRFNVVADTGSNSLIVPSCICSQRGKCRSAHCFTGTNHSSTFQLIERGGSPVEVVLTFGSGQIAAVIAKDTVSVGSTRIFMDDGLLLMVDQALDIAGPFEGILGLGLPEQEGADTPFPPATASDTEVEGLDHMQEGDIQGLSDDQVRSILKKIMQQRAGEDGTDNLEDIIPGWGDGDDSHVAPSFLGSRPAAAKQVLHRHGRTQSSNITALSATPHAKSFLQQASVPRFSMCFNDGAGGALRLGTPVVPGALGSVGRAHWGLDFRGISVGDGAAASAAPLFCGRKDMQLGQETPCGAIPDSGTTMIMGPSGQLATLMEAICDGWPRCAANFSAFERAASAAKAAAVENYGFSPWKFEPASKAQVMELLLEDCHSWLPTSQQGLGELPPLRFHVAGAAAAEGSQVQAQVLELKAVDYVFEQIIDPQVAVPAQGSSAHGNSTTAHADPAAKVCAAAFAPMEYPTKLNGPVWILGLPLFYAYTVAYDTQAVPPTVAFTSVAEAPCGGCAGEVGLVSTDRSIAAVSERARLRSPRRIQGPLRGPSIDVRRPL